MPQDISNTLECADIFILPDNDIPGQEFAMKIANSLTKSNTIKILDLKKKWPNLEEKADITDVFEMVNNDEEVLKKLEELEKETPIYNEKVKLDKGKIRKKDKELQKYENTIQIDGKEMKIELTIPEDYKIEENKILVHILEGRKYRWIKLSRNLVFIKSILENVDSGEQKVELIYYKSAKREWKSIIIDKNVLNNSHSILMLGNKGIPVTSKNSILWVEYLSELEQENYDKLPVIRTVNRLGWVDDKVFVPYANEDVKLEAEENASSWLEGFKSKGKLENWVKIMKPLRENNIFRVVLASGFVPPLLKYIGARTFIVNVWRIEQEWKISKFICKFKCMAETLKN